MQKWAMLSGCYIAEGPSGLEKLLNELYEETRLDSIFAAKEHYILYRFGQQKSLIKLDFSTPPFQFWYYDLWGRPATNIVKETIAHFLLEKGGGQGRSEAASPPGAHYYD